jgi:hypothetical protein
MNPSERRSSPRFRAQPGTYIVYVEGSGAIRDLTLDGAFVLDPEPLPPGTFIRFSLHAGILDIPLKGVVRRAVFDDGMYIQFTDLIPEVKQQLQSYLASLPQLVTETVRR